MSAQTPRMLLAQVRNGDYAHPGDEEAIDLLISTIQQILPEFSPLNILDVGCGLGGTAQYLKTKLNANVIGVDLDSKANLTQEKNILLFSLLKVTF